MKYSNIMGYKNYVGRKAYQQAKSEGKSQEESIKISIDRFGEVDILKNQLKEIYSVQKSFSKKIFNIVYLLFIIYNDIIRLQLQLFLSSFLKKCIEKRLSSGSHFLYAPLSFILLIFPFH